MRDAHPRPAVGTLAEEDRAERHDPEDGRALQEDRVGRRSSSSPTRGSTRPSRRRPRRAAAAPAGRPGSARDERQQRQAGEQPPVERDRQRVEVQRLRDRRRRCSRAPPPPGRTIDPSFPDIPAIPVDLHVMRRPAAGDDVEPAVAVEVGGHRVLAADAAVVDRVPLERQRPGFAPGFGSKTKTPGPRGAEVPALFGSRWPMISSSSPSPSRFGAPDGVAPLQRLGDHRPRPERRRRRARRRDRAVGPAGGV